jgi:cell division septum initiation protein DivIVA
VDVEAAIEALQQILAEARPVPLSASIIVNKVDIDEAVIALRSALPDELRQARWVLKERDELLAQAARESDRILADAREERRRIVSETAVVREAAKEAERIVSEARQEADSLRTEAEDYIDGKLAGFEITLSKTMRAVERGRENLRERLSSERLSSAPGTERELILQAEGLPGHRSPSQFYDHETGQ